MTDKTQALTDERVWAAIDRVAGALPAMYGDQLMEVGQSLETLRQCLEERNKLVEAVRDLAKAYEAALNIMTAEIGKLHKSSVLTEHAEIISQIAKEAQG